MPSRRASPASAAAAAIVWVALPSRTDNNS
jgi:hypothetical protein